MSQKTMIMIAMSVGAIIGGLVPLLWGDRDIASGASILGGLVGGIVGIWAGAKVARQLR